MRRPGRLALLTALVVPLAGCALVRGTARSYVLAPNGLEAREERLRAALAAGELTAALSTVRSKKDAPEDELLRALYHGTVAYYAGDYGASASALQRAYDLTEDRYTKSASRAALSMLTNDRALPYVPGDNERLMVHYYGMQGFLARGDVAGAAVEARRLAGLLERFDERRGDRDASTRATLRFLTGLVFEAAGEPADADVAFRNARALLAVGADSARAPAPLLAAGLAAKPALPAAAAAAPAPAGTGTVVVVLEEGFVAHRVERSLSVALSEEEVHAFGEGSDDDRWRSAERIGGRWVRHHGGGFDDGGGWSGAGDELPYLLQIALPAYQRSYAPPLAPAAVRAGPASAGFTYVADLSDAADGDFARDRVKLLTRAVARAGTKYALAELASRKKKSDEEREEDDDGGEDGKKRKKRKSRGLDVDWGKMAVNLVGVALERADTRSWHLLPARVSVARLSLPPGRHVLRLDAGGAQAAALDTVEVRAGTATFVTRRLWRGIEAPAARPAAADSAAADSIAPR